MAEVTKLTQEAYNKLTKELEFLKVVERKRVAQALKEAMAQGDLSENAEYDAARDAKRELDHKIEELESLLANAEIVATDELPTDEVNMGSVVTLFDLEEEEELEFTIVSSTETDSAQGKISLESPMGMALKNKRVGDVVDVMGFNYEIRKIAR